MLLCTSYLPNTPRAWKHGRCEQKRQVESHKKLRLERERPPYFTGTGARARESAREEVRSGTKEWRNQGETPKLEQIISGNSEWENTSSATWKYLAECFVLCSTATKPGDRIEDGERI